MTNNGPEVQLGMSRELAQFVIKNCDSNLTLGLSFLQNVSRETAEKLVAQMEKFKELRKSAQEALKDGT